VTQRRKQRGARPRSADALPGAGVGASASPAPSLDGLPSLSETMLAFGAPLLTLLEQPPPLSSLGGAVHLVTVAWNLPVFERLGAPQAATYRRQLETATVGVPAAVTRTIASMLAARLATYAHDPRLGFLDVVKVSEERVEIVATSFLPNDHPLQPGTARSGDRQGR
jgi:hypothetical protein